MFNLKTFIKKNIVNGVKNGTFSKEYGNIMAVNYFAKNLLTEDDVMSIDTEITTWEEAKNMVETTEIETEMEIEPTETETEIATEY